ncbi:signal recognition particle receptor subunit alpha homolog [Macrosteles quadrilineatus]|uniref:signal recognition particle receptor subunit alpha homolog n=1 Tax=Macrosteles quadrilineatus TaxID=74068 RepID=UPI0023E20F3D|nr:signal recognition particle receptor subunit alpha homolog [Macrosteles quadrilineatus]
MLDLFTIFSKGGIVLWCFQVQGTSQIFTSSVNALIKSVILQERSGSNSFDHQSLTLQYKLDNEFELVFVVAYQKILKLSYIDKFLDDVHLEFRDKYKDDLQNARYFQEFDFKSNYSEVLKAAQNWSLKQARIPKQMRTFEESDKSKKTVASMIERKGEEKETKKKVKVVEPVKKEVVEEVEVATNGDLLSEDILMENRRKLAQKLGSPNARKSKPKSPKPAKEGKKPRKWDLSGNTKDLVDLDRTKDKPQEDHEIQADTHLVGKMVGGIQDLEVESSEEEEDDDEDEEMGSQNNKTASKSSGVFSMFRGLVGQKSLSRESMEPVLEKLRDHLIAKNVAADIALKLCNSVATKLEGKVIGTFETIASTVKTTLTDSLVQILSPRRRVDILRDALEAKKQGKPFVMCFCGVNGVGKSTNLAKICFWLIENNLRVLIAACDTFRAGAVEQLRTHTRHLNALHPAERHNNQQMVQLFEKGYGKDAAGIAMEAINFARDSRIDVVLVDTAGRMQDNEPLMRALAKLVKVNEPDLVLFVGEALVGNEAVDQLVKFNQAMADYSDSTNPHVIDGIVLTKFDTIDDKVGAAISMTYITGQPIVFVGTGQTYTDLKSLNAKAVVNALMK